MRAYFLMELRKYITSLIGKSFLRFWDAIILWKRVEFRKKYLDFEIFLRGVLTH